MTHSVPVLDFGSQTAQLIVRRVRELGVYSELVPCDAPAEMVRRLDPRGLILSGGPASVYEPGAPRFPAWLHAIDLPVLGICYGMQLQSFALGGRVTPAAEREYGPATIELTGDGPLFAGTPREQPVWMSHGDRIEALPPTFRPLARSANTPFAAAGDETRRWYGIQFHPEVVHTRFGLELLRNFLYTICGCAGDWRAANVVASAVERIRAQVGDAKVLCGLSGGVDSDERDAEVLSERRDDLPGFAQAEQPVVHEDARELVADGAVDEQRRDRRVDAA